MHLLSHKKSEIKFGIEFGSARLKLKRKLRAKHCEPVILQHGLIEYVSLVLLLLAQQKWAGIFSFGGI